MSKLIPDTLSNLIVGDTFYFVDEDYFYKYDKSREKYDSWKFMCAAIKIHPENTKVCVDIIAFANDWQETGEWPEAWRCIFPANVAVAIEAHKTAENKRAEWEAFAAGLRGRIQKAIDDGEAKEVVKTRGLQLIHMLEIIESAFFDDEEEEDEQA